MAIYIYLDAVWLFIYLYMQCGKKWSKQGSKQWLSIEAAPGPGPRHRGVRKQAGCQLSTVDPRKYVEKILINWVQGTASRES